MFILWTLAVLVLTLDSQVHTGKIIHGHETIKHSRPYMVLLERKFGGHISKHCGGFLINEDFLITAAHCQASSYKVYLGLHNYLSSDGVQLRSVAQEFPHKQYNKKNIENDIMLLKLSTKANITNNVKPISLVEWVNNTLPKSCSISGWGSTEKSKQMSLKLMEVDVNLVEHKKCAGKKIYCSVGPAGPGIGDSGGPLVCEDGKAYGVIAAGIWDNASAQTVFGYVKIFDKLDWIKKIIKT